MWLVWKMRLVDWGSCGVAGKLSYAVGDAAGGGDSLFLLKASHCFSKRH